MTRWLITGANGQLGRDLRRLLADRDVIALTRSELDLGDETAVRDVVGSWVRRDSEAAVVVNAAGYTAVDDAETDEPTAHVVNGLAPGWIASACAGRARLVHVSTDYVFAGDASTPYTLGHPTGPRTAYGRTKLAGERAVLAAGADAFVVRTAWVYSEHGGNFVDTMLRLERERDTVSVVADQQGSPTWSAQLAGGLVQLGTAAVSPGVLHCTGAGDTTWYGLARAVFEAAGADPGRVLPTTTDRFSRPAPRPAYSVLDNSAWIAAGLEPLPDWRDAVAEVVRRIRGRA